MKVRCLLEGYLYDGNAPYYRTVPYLLKGRGSAPGSVGDAHTPGRMYHVCQDLWSGRTSKTHPVEPTLQGALQGTAEYRYNPSVCVQDNPPSWLHSFMLPVDSRSG